MGSFNCVTKRYDLNIDWEQRRLGEVFDQTSNLVNPREEHIELWSLTVARGLTPKTDRYNREFLVKKDDQFKTVANNEFIYNPMNMTLGASDLNLMGKTVAVSGYYITMISKDGYESNYFNIWLKSEIAIKKYKIYATGSLIERQRIQFPTLSKIKVLVPNLQEQEKIGTLFNRLDNTIALHQHKLQILKEMQQGFLQLLFPNINESNPQLRTTTFKNEWGQRKLADFLKIPQKIKIVVTDTSELLTLKLNLGGIKSGVNRSTLSLGSTIYYKRLAGQFIYGKQNFFNGSMAIIPDEFDGKATSGDVPSFDVVGINPLFLLTFISRKSYWKRKEVNATGTGSKRIHEKTLQNFDIKVPSLKEQEKVSEFFKQISDVISFQQQKIDKLQKIKKAYLQKMFI